MKLLDDVLICPPGERSALLARTCGDDSELRQEIEALVESAEQDSAVFETPAFSIHDEPQFTGPYRLQDLLGHGGMGSVYLAVREDELQSQDHAGEAETELRAALKVQRLSLPEDHGHVAATKRNLAAVLAAKNPREGGRLAREALAVFRKNQPPDSWQIAYTEGVLGACLAGLQRYDEAEKLLTGSYQRVRAARGESALYTRNIHRWIVELYQVMGKPDQADAFFAGS